MIESDNVPLPKKGDTIYVPCAMSMSHGVTDVRGGRATVVRLHPGISAGKRVHFVELEEHDRQWNWEQFLYPQQERLRAEYGDQRAAPDPDDRPEFNTGW